MSSITSSLQPYLPSDAQAGLLPYWQLLIAVTALGSGITSLFSSGSAKKVYNNAGVTPLQARNFGVWNITSSIVRLVAAYNISNKPVYALAFATYLIAFVHFQSEFIFFKTAKMEGGLVAPTIVSSVSLLWMYLQYGYYIKA